MPKSPRTRFDVTFNPRFAEDFETLAEEEGLSRAELFKRAFAFYKIWKQIKCPGKKLIIKYPNPNEPERELIIL